MTHAAAVHGILRCSRTRSRCAPRAVQLVGYLAATQGTAFINGADAGAATAAMHPGMGVCPQDNLLWDTLTAEEHLLFYARLKGLSGRGAAAAVEEALCDVALLDRRRSRAGTFSGGASPLSSASRSPRSGSCSACSASGSPDAGSCRRCHPRGGTNLRPARGQLCLTWWCCVASALACRAALHA